MADVVVTAANVQKDATTRIAQGIFGATVTAGQTVYLDAADGKWKLADANASAITAALVGVALNGGADGQPGFIAIGGNFNPGFTAVVGTIYVLSATAGGIAPAADLLTGWRTAIVGVGLAANSLGLVNYASGALVP
jgi:hypothetical protein